MLKRNAQKLIDTLMSSVGSGETRLILAALMTETLSKVDPITNTDMYLYQLCNNFDILGNSELLEKRFERSKNFSDNY